MDFEEKIKKAIMADPANQAFNDKGYIPLFSAHPEAKIILIGQAPGIRAQESGQLWQDKSGQRLMGFLGVDEETFFNPQIFAHIPMDFYFPGKGKSGDKKPRKAFAKKWHPQVLAHIKAPQLTLLIGQSAQDFYLKGDGRKNLTDRVRHYKDYLPDYFPLVHPSPRNQIWTHKNPWFEKEVLPDLRDRVQKIINS
ncbi:MAG: uracil-DNA glycosylase family protein [Tissierellia bacterium]|nr:uracil-DNA glycosylase family protein [Tissierellia bacterium]